MSKKKQMCINSLAELVKEVENPSVKTRISSLSELSNLYMHTDDKTERKKLTREFVKRQKELQDFIKSNPDLVNAQMEQALISAALGGEYIDEEIKLLNGKKTIKRTKKHIAPNYAAALKYLENKDKENWSPNPKADPELEDVSDIEDDIYGSD